MRRVDPEDLLEDRERDDDSKQDRLAWLIARRQHSPVMRYDEHQAVGIRRSGAGNGWRAGNRIENAAAAGAREAMQVPVGHRRQPFAGQIVAIGRRR